MSDRTADVHHLFFFGGREYDLLGEGDALCRDLYEYAGTLPMRLIRIGGEPYLERYYLSGSEQEGCRYLHRFVGADGDRNLHNHPWPWSRSTILTGGYSEMRRSRHRTSARLAHYGPGDVNDIGPLILHQIVDVVPGTWTLFEHGPWDRQWGFIDRNGAFIPESDERGSSRFLGWWRTSPVGSEHPERLPMTLPRPTDRDVPTGTLKHGEHAHDAGVLRPPDDPVG